MAYLLQTYGSANLQHLFHVRSSEFESRFASIYGRPLSVVQEEWLAFCDSQG
jgi:hypothetical protein